MVILLCAGLQLRSYLAKLVLALSKLSFVVHKLGFDVPLLHSLQIDIFREQVNLILLFDRELVMRFLHKLELVLNDLELTFELLGLLLQGD